MKIIALLWLLLICTITVSASGSDCEQGDALRRANRVVEAITQYEKCLKTASGSAVLHHNLGVLYLETDDLSKARHRLESAISLAPSSAVSHSALGEVLLLLGRCHDAAAAHRRAAQAAARAGVDVDAHRNVYLLTLLKCPTAIQSREVLTVGQGGNAPSALADAVPSESRCSDWSVWLRVGTVALNGQRCAEAVAAFRVALRLGAQGDDALFGSGMCLAQDKDHSGAAGMFSAAARRGSSRQTLARMAAAMNRARSADWTRFEARRTELVEDIERRFLPSVLRDAAARQQLLAGRGVEEEAVTFERTPVFACVQPHEALVLDLPLHTFRAVATVYAKSQMASPLHAPAPAHRSWTASSARASRLVLGYLSSDFAAHATSHLLKGAFAEHAARGLPARCFSAEASEGAAESGARGWKSEIAEQCRMHLLHPGMSGEEAAAVVADERVQVLLNLNGWTAGHRNDVFEHRAAPVQCNYLGYPGTMGAAYMDYFLSDRIATPPELAEAFTEKLAVVPGCYYVNDHARYHRPEAEEQEAAGAPGSEGRAAALAKARERAGIPGRCEVVAANLNQVYKVTPGVFDGWVRAVASEPAGCLWQIAHRLPAQQRRGDGAAAEGGGADVAGVQGRMARRAAQQGVGAERLLWTEDTDIVEFIRRCALADVVLDTGPITAHTVAMDVLWMGTPLVTAPSRQFASRVAASVLAALSPAAAALIARSLQDAEALARALLRGPRAAARRVALRQQMEGARWGSPLFNTSRSVAMLERAARLMWEVQRARGPRMHVIVADT